MEFSEFNFADISKIRVPKNQVTISWSELVNQGVVFRLPGEKQLWIRRLKAKDVGAVQMLEKETFPSPWSKESFLYRLADHTFNLSLVGEIEKKVIAYAVSYIVYDELHFSNLAVDKILLRNRIGEILLWLSLHIGIENNCQIVNLEVRRSNTPAISLYKKYGFQIVGIRKNYYSREREDALLMSKAINWETPYGMV